MADYSEKSDMHKGDFDAFKKGNKDNGVWEWIIFMATKAFAIPAKFIIRGPSTIGSHQYGFFSSILSFVQILIFANWPDHKRVGDNPFEEGTGSHSILLYGFMIFFALRLVQKIINLANEGNQPQPEYSGTSYIAKAIAKRITTESDSAPTDANQLSLMRESSIDVQIPNGLHNFVKAGLEPGIIFLLGWVLNSTILPATGAYFMISGICICFCELRTIRYRLFLKDWSGNHH